MEIEDTLDRVRFEARIAKQATKAFAKHTLRRESEISWYCGAPGTRIHSFWLAFLPYHIVMVGDLSGRIFQVSDMGSLPWLLGSIESQSYLLGKATNPEWAFLVKEANAAMKEHLREADPSDKDHLQDAKREWDQTPDKDDDTWSKLWWDELGECEPPDCTTFSSQMLWQYYGLKRFCELYEAQQAALPPPVMQHPTREPKKVSRQKKAAR